ncbi:MAG: alanine--tRNA ligase [Candidatus Paceibacterota bacterium]|jgi:alanyl-tRNA synthetase
MNSAEIRSKFLKFFEKRGHTIIPSASLVTTDEKGITNPTLFNTAGMQPLIPYLLGKPYIIDGKEITRLADSQKCLRTVDIDDIGDKTHATFFEMLGNWSLGDYFKKEAIGWSYEFLTSKEEGLGLDPNRLYVTVFEGDENAPKDTEAADIWKEIFNKSGLNSRIFYLPAENNWWQAGDNGPCGPDSEMYYDVLNKFGGRGLTKQEFLAADSVRDVVEVWNDVFMQYEKKDGKIIGKLPKPSVDTGAGLERLAMTLQEVDNIYETDLLKSVMEKIKEFSKNWDLKAARIVADHIKASVFLITDGVVSSNTDRGYVLRKLIRRAVRYADKLELGEQSKLDSIIKAVIEIYKEIYPEIVGKQGIIITEILDEEIKFRQTLKQGLKEFEKGIDAFTLFSSYGFPLELTIELAKEKGVKIDIKDFEDKFKKHQELSRLGAEQKFKGGLASTDNEMVVRYHTATHLLHQALHDIFGDEVMQKGSNITEERLRFDFSHGTKMTDEEKKKVEDIVNSKIQAVLPVQKVVMSLNEAEKTGARHFFGDKYGDEISIYFIGNDLDSAYSKEFCGGPHVSNTKDLAGPEGKWRFKIQKEEAVAQGVRRIKAVLQ